MLGPMSGRRWERSERVADAFVFPLNLRAGSVACSSSRLGLLDEAKSTLTGIASRFSSFWLSFGTCRINQVVIPLQFNVR